MHSFEADFRDFWIFGSGFPGFYCFLDESRADSEDFHEFERQHCVTVFDGQWKYNRYEGEEYGELYDLENDPMEHINLWGKCPKQQMRMAEIMLERLIRSHDQLPLPHSHY